MSLQKEGVSTAKVEICRLPLDSQKAKVLDYLQPAKSKALNGTIRRQIMGTCSTKTDLIVIGTVY